MNISLLIPCYNAERYLPQLFNSINQSQKPFAEIICYDDGSTDNTAQIAESYGAIVIRGERCRLGPSVGRNRLAVAAKYEWIKFHDADDELHPLFLERLSDFLSDKNDVIGCNVDWQDEVTKETVLCFHYAQQEINNDPLRYFLSHPINHHGAIHRKEVFLAVGGFDETSRCWEDADLHIRLAAHGAKFHIVEEVLAVSLRHQRGLSSNQKHCWNCRLRFLEHYAKVLPPRVLPDIAAQTERAASALLKEGDIAGAQKAVHLCASLNHAIPTTQNMLLKSARRVLSPITLLRIQQLIRDWSHKNRTFNN